MKTVKVIFKNEKYNYYTSVSEQTTKESAKDYFVNTVFDVGSYPHENMQECIKIELREYKNIENSEKTSYNYTLNRLGFKVFKIDKSIYLELNEKTIIRPQGNGYNSIGEKIEKAFNIDFKKELELSKKEVVQLEPLTNNNTLDSQLKKITGFGWCSLYWKNANNNKKDVSAKKGNIIKCLKTGVLVQLN